VAILLVLTATAWCVVGVRGHILHQGYPRNSLFVAPELRFTDFTLLSERVAHFGERNMLTRTDVIPYPYPVPSIYAFLFFIRLFPNALAVYLLFAVLSFLLATCIFSLRIHQITSKRLPQIALWLTLLMGFPLLFLLDRGNIEAVIWVLITLSIVAYTRDRMLTAALLLGLATSMKIFPGLLFLLFLAKRKYGAFALAIAATALFSIASLAGVGPSIRQAAADSSKSAQFLKDSYINVRTVMQFDHSLFGAAKQAIYVYHHRDLSQLKAAITNTLPFYSVLIPLAVVLLYLVRIRHLPVLNQLASYLVLCVLLPYVSYEYTLVYIYLVWGIFLLFLLTDVVSGRVQISNRAINAIMVSCAVIFAPLSYIVFGRSFGLGGQIKTVFLIVVLWTVLKVPMPSSVFGDLDFKENPGNYSGM
jgi:Glycosyltransferase family 87